MAQPGEDDQRAADGDEFTADLVSHPDAGRAGTSHAGEIHNATEDKELHALLGLDSDELDRVPMLDAGTRLEQGAVYVDLDDPDRQPFKALGGRETGPGDRLVSKRDTDHELWNRLVGQGREAVVERPDGATEA